MQRIVGTGTIIVSSADKTLGEFELKNIKNPAEVKEKLSEIVEKNRDQKRVTSREFMGEDDLLDEE